MSFGGLSIVVPVFRPSAAHLRSLVESLLRNVFDKQWVRVCFVSENPSHELLLENSQLLCSAGVHCEVAAQRSPGSFPARLMGANRVPGCDVLFLDSDFELASNYLTHCRQLLEFDLAVGCWSGKVLLPEGLKLPDWMKESRGLWNLKDCGDQVVCGWTGDGWEPWFPTTASGLLVRSEVLEALCRADLSTDLLQRLGPCGAASYTLDGWLIGKFAQQCRLKSSYRPELVLVHNFDVGRLRLWNFALRHFWLGRSRVVMAALTKDRPPCQGLRQRFGDVFGKNGRTLRDRLCQAAYHSGIALELLLES